MVVFCLILDTLLIFNFGGSVCDDELCIVWSKVMHDFHSSLLSMIYNIVGCILFSSRYFLIFNFGGSVCDDELCIVWCKVIHIFN